MIGSASPAEKKQSYLHAAHKGLKVSANDTRPFVVAPARHALTPVLSLLSPFVVSAVVSALLAALQAEEAAARQQEQEQRKASAGDLNIANVRGMLLDLPEFTELASLGIAVSVREASGGGGGDADAADARQAVRQSGAAVGGGRVVLAYDGPANLRRAVELNLRNALVAADPRVRVVVFES